CARLRSGYARPPPHAAQGHLQQTSIILSEKGVPLRRRSGVPFERRLTPDAQIFESGGSEGNFTHYRDHHLGPELREFKSFTFRDYKIAVQGEGKLAVATETYSFSITLANSDKMERDGVATSVLQWANGQWQIINLHSSSRKPKAR
ncbi:MAG: nuclear transport factor 2 family protein, partial [Sphingopyxis sp.]